MGGVMPIKSNQRQDGYSLVEVLVAAALLGLVLYIAQTQMLMNFKFNKQQTDRYELIELGHNIERLVDCPKVPKVCPVTNPVKFIELQNKKTNNVLIEKDTGSRFGEWTVAAECAPDNTIVLRAAKLDGKGTPYKDPLTNKPMDWADLNGVIFPAGALCSAERAPAGIPADLDVGMVAGPACVVPDETNLPCSPPLPPPCNAGYDDAGMTIDTFGGENSSVGTSVSGQRWLRYCLQSAPP